MTIKRYSISFSSWGAELRENPHAGDFVHYDDHIAALRREREPVEPVAWRTGSDVMLSRDRAENLIAMGAKVYPLYATPPDPLALVAAAYRDAAEASDTTAGAVQEAARKFDHADWYWRVMDPDDCGDTPEEVVNRAMLGNFCVCEIASSFTGPTRYGFTAPVLNPESDDKEFLHFATQQEAIDATKERIAALRALAGETE